MTNDNIISLRGVTKRFGSLAAVDDVTIDVPRGRCFAWLGPNGCGKTTLIRMMLGLARPTAGSIEVRGFSIPHHTSEALARVGGIVEEPRFYPYLSGRANLEVWAAHFGPDAVGRIDAALDRVNLGDRGGDAVKKYSLGMRQRLGVARALLNDPELLILDEPTNGLDPAGLAEFRLLIRSFVDEGRTVFISSHILGEVQKMADDVAIIQAGRVVAFGSVEQMLSGGRQAIIVRSSDADAADAAVRQVPGVTGTKRLVDGSLDVSVAQSGDETLGAISAALFGAGLPIYGLWAVQDSLEERFLQITGGDAGEITGSALDPSAEVS
ncbi:MAG: ABC transporter ATP-binding protein [Thermoleophilaceae bacterium]|nr:ABC transporter ATP-binding protein [Thermoleophilaceae bacterium]